MAYETRLGEATLTVIETGAKRFRVELDGERRRVRVRRELHDIDSPRAGSHGWVEGDEADLDLLVECLTWPHARRVEHADRLVFESSEVGLSGYDASITVAVAMDGPVVVVDMRHRINEVNPHVGW